MISLAIASFNESEKLERCLKSLKGFADEILIFNLSRVDRNIRVVAKKFGAKLIDIDKVSYIELIRNKMIEACGGEWVILLDPDEYITDDLKKKLKEISKSGKYDAVNIPRKNIIFGKWIKHTNWWPDRQIRFFKKGKVLWKKDIHSYPQVQGKIFELPGTENLAIVHKQYDNIYEFLARQNRYSEIEAENLIQRGVDPTFFNLFWWPIRVFLSRFIRHFGFLDGFEGFSLTYLMMIYKVSVWVKIWERSKKFNLAVKHFLKTL